MNGTLIERSVCERFLGVLVDDNLSWSNHIKSLASKISRNSGIMYKLKGIVPDSVLKTLYNSFIQSNLNYCSTVWGLRSKNSVEPLFRAQKKAIRTVENRYNLFFYNKDTGECPCHTKEIFERNDFLTVHNLIAKNCLSMMQKVYIGLCPQPIQIKSNQIKYSFYIPPIPILTSQILIEKVTWAVPKRFASSQLNFIWSLSLT